MFSFFSVNFLKEMFIFLYIKYTEYISSFPISPFWAFSSPYPFPAFFPSSFNEIFPNLP